MRRPLGPPTSVAAFSSAFTILPSATSGSAELATLPIDATPTLLPSAMAPDSRYGRTCLNAAITSGDFANSRAARRFDPAATSASSYTAAVTAV